MVTTETTPTPTRRHRRIFFLVLVLAVAVLAAATALVALASTPLGVAGYLDHSYAGDHTINEPTNNSAESKLWWHDGHWWGVLYSTAQNRFNIHRLDVTTQTWIDTGILVDDRVGDPDSETDSGRRQSRSDALMDSTAGKLYIVTHRVHLEGRRNNNTLNQARLMVYSYNAGSDSWTPDAGYPVSVNQDMTESVVLDKDDDGRLWVTYVSQDPGSGTYHVWVNASAPGNPASWGTPFIIPVGGGAATVSADDISAVLAFGTPGDPKVAVMWSNQEAGHEQFYLAVRDAGAGDADSGWALEPGLATAVPYPGDDHINMKRAPNGDLLAVVKTNSAPASGDPLIGVVRRTTGGSYTFHPVSPSNSADTRPIMLVDTAGDQDQVHVFSVSKQDGGNVCQHSAPLNTLAFTVDNCMPPPITCEGTTPELLALGVAIAPVFIGDDDTTCNINDPTTTKQWVTDASGIAVLASDENDDVYVHNAVGGSAPPPTVTVTVEPTPIPGDSFDIYLPLVSKD